MNNNIHPCIWYDGNAKAAAEFYCTLFPESKITTDTPMVVNFELHGQKFMGLNGGPMFKTNPSISFMAISESDDEINQLWKKISDGGFVMMPLDKYPWSEKYGFVQDKFGLSWQIMRVIQDNVKQKITPTFLFVGNNYGKAADAIKFYTEVFPPGVTNNISFYGEEDGEQAGKVKHAQFTIDGKVFMAMDGHGPHNFAFNEALSFVVECKDQQEIDYFWDTLTSNGGKESRCGWLVDKFGVSWQIIPKNIGQLMSRPGKAQKIMEVIMPMNKLNIAAIEKAAE